jgi:hypothetical protein
MVLESNGSQPALYVPLHTVVVVVMVVIVVTVVW